MWIGRARKFCLFLAIVLMLSGLCAAIAKPKPAYNSAKGYSILITESTRTQGDKVCVMDMLPALDYASGHNDSTGAQWDFKIYLSVFLGSIYLAPQGMSAFVFGIEKFFYPNSAGLVEGYIHRSDGKKRA